MRIVVLVPRRRDHGRRDATWAYVRSRWKSEHPEFEIFEGHHNGGRFNRSKAINRAARKAGAFDVAIINDSDTFPGPERIDAAIEAMTTEPVSGFVLPFDRFMYLRRETSDQIMAGTRRGDWESGTEWGMTGTCSSVVMVTRRVWDLATGFDEGFKGWGFEDVAFSHAAQAFAGGLLRIPGPVWHLWHPSSTENDGGPQWEENRLRMHLYQQAAYADGRYTPDAMAALIEQLKETST